MDPSIVCETIPDWVDAELSYAVSKYASMDRPPRVTTAITADGLRPPRREGEVGGDAHDDYYVYLNKVVQARRIDTTGNLQLTQAMGKFMNVSVVLDASIQAEIAGIGVGQYATGYKRETQPAMGRLMPTIDELPPLPDASYASELDSRLAGIRSKLLDNDLDAASSRIRELITQQAPMLVACVAEAGVWAAPGQPSGGGEDELQPWEEFTSGPGLRGGALVRF